MVTMTLAPGETILKLLAATSEVCDRCGVAAEYAVLIDAERLRILTFCGHHAREYGFTPALTEHGEPVMDAKDPQSQSSSQSSQSQSQSPPPPPPPQMFGPGGVI